MMAYESNFILLLCPRCPVYIIFFLIFQLLNTFVAKLFFHQNENVDIKKELFIATGLYGDFALQTT